MGLIVFDDRRSVALWNIFSQSSLSWSHWDAKRDRRRSDRETKLYLLRVDAVFVLLTVDKNVRRVRVVGEERASVQKGFLRPPRELPSRPTATLQYTLPRDKRSVSESARGRTFDVSFLLAHCSSSLPLHLCVCNRKRKPQCGRSIQAKRRSNLTHRSVTDSN